MHLGSENPKEYLSLALNLTFPVSKSPSIAVLIGDLTKCFNPLGTSVNKKNESVSVKKLLTLYPCGIIPIEAIALISLSAVEVL